MPATAKKERLYLIPVLTKALDILELLQNQGEPLVLEAIHRQTRISKTTAYRILKTLVHRGYIAQTSDRTYRFVARPKKLRFGLGGQSAEMPFSESVSASLRAACASTGIDLLILDNKYDATVAIQNAEAFVRERVDVVIEFQVDEHAAPIIADRISAARIPLIAVDIPHPNAIYFGVDNYRAGLVAGEMLGDFAVNRWGGKVDWIIGLDLASAGQLVQSRITGAFEGVRSKIAGLPFESFVRIDGRGMHERSYKVMLEFLKRHPDDKHILIAANNDVSALGAIAALRELKREKHAAVVGQDLVDEMKVEMRRRGSPAIGSVSHEVHQYGPRIVELALALLRGETVPPYIYAEHRAVPAHLSREAQTAEGAPAAPARKSARARSGARLEKLAG